MVMKTKNLTPTQLRLLQSLSDSEFEFPAKGCYVMSFEKLERLGLVEGSLEPSVWDSRRGVTKFSRAFRRTRTGTDAVVNEST